MGYDNKEYWSGLIGNTMSLKEVGWPNWTEAYNKYHYRIRAENVDQTINRFISIEPGTILEIGCGVGFWTKFITKKFPNASYTGVDISEKAISVLNENNTNPKLKFVQQDISQPYNNLSQLITQNKYDLIICFRVLLHIVDDGSWKNALENICRLKTADGTLLLSDAVMLLDQTGTNPSDNHCKLRTLTDYQSIIKNSGLAIKTILPETFLFDNNVDFKNKYSKKAWDSFFKVYNRILSIKSEALGSFIGFIAYYFDKLFLKFTKYGHSTKMLVIK
jgi:SAM-dependent methyltransferase